MLPPLLLLPALLQSSAAGATTVVLDTPVRVDSRIASEGNFWFPCCMTVVDDVAVLRVNVVPDATYTHTPAAVFSSVDNGASFQPQTPRACAQFDEAACALRQKDAAGGSHTAPAAQWTMMIPQRAEMEAGGSPGSAVLGISAQARVLGGWNRRGLEWTGQRLLVMPDGEVRATGAPVNVTLTGLPRDVALTLEKNTVWNSSKVSAAEDHLAAAVLAVGGKGVHLPPANSSSGSAGGGGGSDSTVLAMVELAYQDCQGSKTDACSYVLCIESVDAGVTWAVRSTVSSAANEVAMIALGDGRLLAVMRHDCELDNSTGMVSWRYKQHFSSTAGRSWGAPSLMSARRGSVPPHSVLPTLHRLEGDLGYLLSGGRGGFYVWHCTNISCIDRGEWSATNLGAHHNAAAAANASAGFADPFGPFPKECVDDANWNHEKTGTTRRRGPREVPARPKHTLASFRSVAVASMLLTLLPRRRGRSSRATVIAVRRQQRAGVTKVGACALRAIRLVGCWLTAQVTRCSASVVR